MKRIAILLAFLLALAATSVSAQSLTGTIAGKVVDEQGAVLPGVTVTLVGKQGAVPAVTDANGEYRFVGLNPGMYEVKSELAGFAPRAETNLDLGIGRLLTVNFTLKVGGMTETVDVVGNAATIDITSTATDNSLSSDLLQNMPINVGNFNAATALLNYAPGVNSGSGFGGDANAGNALLIDGVDTRDPEAGTAWVFFNFNIVEEVQVGGLGAPAEYGGFSGAVVNTITKSGGNKYSGLFEVRHTNKDLATKNTSAENLKLNPALGSSAVLKKLNDYTVQMGGPIKKDKAFWWFSAQRYAVEADPIGPRTIQTEVSPRYNGKLTFQLTPNDTLVGSFQFDNYNVTGRTGYAGSYSTDKQTVRQDSPEAIWNAQYRKVFGSSTFLEAKLTGYWGYYYLDPVDPASARYDGDTGAYSGGAGYFYYADRGRNQGNISVSKYADLFGKHNFKFGMEFERSSSHSRSEYSNGHYFYDYAGPYLAYSGSQYNIEGRNKRESYYAQDSWQKGRLTANLGLRLDHIRGDSPNDKGTLYAPKLGIGPRAGLAIDVTGKGTSLLKGFWGRYFEGASNNIWQRAQTGFFPFISYDVLPGDKLVEYDRVPAFQYKVATDMDHPAVDEINIGFEQQLRRDMRLAVTGISRKYVNFANSVIPKGTWATTTVNNPLTSTPITLYKWVNRTATSTDKLVRNLDGFQFKDASGNVIKSANPYRDYKGVMVVLTKSYSNRWQGQVSYVWSEANGTVSNSGSGSSNSGYWENPNASLVNSDGPMPSDRTHEIKVFAGFQIPKIDVSLNAYYRAVSGTPYAADMSVSGSTLNWPGSTTVFLEPRGSRRLDMFHQVDLRVEKTFNVDVHRFGIFIDAQNLLNADTTTGVQTRYPTRSITYFDDKGAAKSSPVKFGSPTSIQAARQITVGGRWSF